jgi:polysaccharide biosynthesis/export protein
MSIHGGAVRALRAAVSLVVSCGALSVLVACAGSSGAPPASGLKSYKVGPPDELTISILPEPEIQREVVVRPDGMISVDLVGDIPAAGRSVEEIAKDIETRISRYKRDARVSVGVKAALSDQITVLGEVGRPATFPLSRQTRLVEAIGTVGGPTNFAAKGRVRLIRPGEGGTKVFNVDLGAIEKGNLSTNYVLQGGDLIVVPPGVMASIGYGVQSILFPFQQIFGFGASVTTKVFTGGVL